MIPLRDYNKTRNRPYVVYTIVAINVLVFLWETTLSQQRLSDMFINNSVVPLYISDNPLSMEALLDGLRSMFFHGSWLHLGGNMLYLWIFGDNIEDRLGKIGFGVFYLFCGYVAAAAQVLIDPHSKIPLVGASGAIAGVLGAYLLLFPKARVRNLIFLGFYISSVDLPAVFVLGFWFVMQLFSGAASLGVQTSGGTAFFAHIGGFGVGFLLMAVHRGLFGPPPPLPPNDAPLVVEQRRTRHLE